MVTPEGHDVTVWAPVLERALRVSFADLTCALVGDHPAQLLVLAAHPDDETLGLGRFASQWARTVGTVTGVVATAGEACLDHVTTRPADIEQRRYDEWIAATDILGFSDRNLLGLPDGGLASVQDQLRVRVCAVLDALAERRSPVVLAAPWRFDPHPDHQAVGRAAVEVARSRNIELIEYPVWMTYWSEPDRIDAAGQQVVVVDQDQAANEAHRAACHCFISQLEPLAPHLTPVVPPAMLAHHHQQLLITTPGRFDG